MEGLALVSIPAVTGALIVSVALAVRTIDDWLYKRSRDKSMAECELRGGPYDGAVVLIGRCAMSHRLPFESQGSVRMVTYERTAGDGRVFVYAGSD